MTTHITRNARRRFAAPASSARIARIFAADVKDEHYMCEKYICVRSEDVLLGKSSKKFDSSC